MDQDIELVALDRIICKQLQPTIQHHTDEELRCRALNQSSGWILFGI